MKKSGSFLVAALCAYALGGFIGITLSITDTVINNGWFDGVTFSPVQHFIPTLHAQNAAYKQGPLTFTNAAAVQPYLCSDAGVCAGTPSWKNDSAVNGAQISIETNSIRYFYDGSTPTTANGHLVAANGTVILQQRSNVRNWMGIATAANATGWVTVVRN